MRKKKRVEKKKKKEKEKETENGKEKKRMTKKKLFLSILLCLICGNFKGHTHHTAHKYRHTQTKKRTKHTPQTTTTDRPIGWSCVNSSVVDPK